MAFNLQRLRPTRNTLALLVGLLWALSFGAVRDFVWADLREGMIDLRGLSRVTRGIVLLGFGLLAMMIVVLLFNDLWRALFDLRPLIQSAPGRGALVPLLLPPVTLFLLALAWTFGLTGALHGHPALRLGVLLFFAASVLQWLGATTAFATLPELVATWGALGGVLLFFLLRWRAAPRPAWEFLLLLLPVSLIFVLAHARAVSQDNLTGIATGLQTLSAHVLSYTSFVIPLLTLIGIDIALFTYQASYWTSQIVEERLPRVALYGLLLLVGAWRLHAVGGATLAQVAENGWRAEGLGYVGALAVPLLAILVWWLLARVRPAEPEPTIEEVVEAAERHAFPLILFYNLLTLISFTLLYLAGASTFGMTQAPDVRAATMGLLDVLFATSDWVQRYLLPWHVLVAGLMIPAAFWLARRGHRAAALYLGLFGARALWIEATNPGRPLDALLWRGDAPVLFWWVMLLAGSGLFWLLRRELTARRAARLLMLFLITVLLEQTDFIENPFSPFLAFAGIGFLAFGVVWDALTAGAWTNDSSPALPRTTRLFLYIGYVLLTVTVVNWALTTHNLETVGRFTGDAALAGLALFGIPLLHAIIVLTLFGSPTDEEPAARRGGSSDVSFVAAVTD